MLLVLAAALRTTLTLDTRVLACCRTRSVRDAGMLDTLNGSGGLFSSVSLSKITLGC